MRGLFLDVRYIHYIKDTEGLEQHCEEAYNRGNMFEEEREKIVKGSIKEENEWMRKCAECHSSDNILSQEASEKQKEQ